MPSFFFFFFNDTATTEIYTLSLHDALPIWGDAGDAARRCSFPVCGLVERGGVGVDRGSRLAGRRASAPGRRFLDRKSTRLNSSHQIISYAVFCLKKKNNNI